MQQLTLQFDGYAPIGQAKTQGTAKQCQKDDFYEASQHILQGLAKSVTKPSSKILERVPLLAQAAAAVTFGFSLMFLAALIGG